MLTIARNRNQSSLSATYMIGEYLKTVCDIGDHDMAVITASSNLLTTSGLGTDLTGDRVSVGGRRFFIADIFGMALYAGSEEPAPATCAELEVAISRSHAGTGVAAEAFKSACGYLLAANHYEPVEVTVTVGDRQVSGPLLSARYQELVIGGEQLNAWDITRLVAG